MRNERKYIALSVLSFLVIALFLVTCAREPFRMAAALSRQDREWAMLGARLYAQNCVVCHGNRGQGMIGMPLNRKDLQGSPHDPKYKETYQMLLDTITNGRKGTTNPLWVRQPDGHWLSYTAMPAWGRAAGGPMDEHMIQGLVYFIMLGNEKVDPNDPGSPTFWEIIGDEQRAPLQAPTTTGTLPDSANLTPEENARAKALIETELPKRGFPSCLSCHSIGSKGAKFGPDLSNLGQWGLDADFLKRWISNAPAMPKDQRMPVYWSKHRATTGPTPVLKDPVPVELPTAMAAYTRPDGTRAFTDAELDLLVRYLMGLGVKK